MKFKTLSITCLFLLSFVIDWDSFESTKNVGCGHGHQICNLEVGPPLKNPPKIYSPFHQRNRDGYIGLETGRSDNACTTADIEVTYGLGFTPDARNAFEFAVEIWERCVVSDVPILIEATFQPANNPNNLGSARATDFAQGFYDAPLDNTFYSLALANSITNVDLDNTRTDITANLNSSRTDWYFGIDGNCPSDRFDFVTVVLHELCHGLGFQGSGFTDGTPANTIATAQGTGLPIIYDTFVENGAGTQINTFTDGTSALAAQLQSGNLFFDGPNVRNANGGARAAISAPFPFVPGSSYSHYDENVFPGVLMTPLLSAGEVLHNPGDMSISLLEDEGWDVNRPCYSGAVYVDKGHNSAIQLGTFIFPYITFEDAVDNAVQGNFIYFKSSGDHTASTPIVITKRMQLALASGNTGPVIIK